MIRSARSTWLLVGRRPLVIRAVLVPIALAILFTLGPILSAPDTGNEDIAQFLGHDGLVVVLRWMSVPLGILALSLAATTFAQEHSLGLLRNTLVRSPKRIPYLLGRTLAVAVLAVGICVFAAVVGGISGTIALSAKGFHGHDWQGGDIAMSALRSTGVVVGFAVIGGAVATFFRSAAGAIGVSIAWLIGIEGILVGTIWHTGEKVLPAQMMFALAAGPNDDPSVGYGRAAITLALWCSAFLAAALVVFQRRDVS